MRGRAQAEREADSTASDGVEGIAKVELEMMASHARQR